MEITDRLAVVAALNEAHRNAPFPSRWRGGAEVAGFDMIMLDSFPSGCISVWLQQHGVLDDWRWNILAEYEQRLLRVIPELDDYGRAYYQRILDMAVLILEADSPSSSA
ncbi:hypothetical protein KZZ52_42425 [Dactylosporangium sp. AC04546]|uniref:hypothetical protein n=1 Tax=Dactylosporangium sp. AC04546 TaxID=2862460 RepID=UPI001EDDD325|nr:hypothetical protein [Dactylosporangium sp. AC04546]WVK80571.1 hypothetical protein KZZ52_42425 [Dactylosporangium sp. AC04546]